MLRSKLENAYDPSSKSIKILSSALKSPKNRPRPSAFKRRTVSSYHTLRAPKVLTPASFNSTFRTGNLETKLPPAPRPLMAMSLKLTSNLTFFRRAWARKKMDTTSASPLGLAVKYKTLDLGVPLVMGYSRSRVMEVTLKRFTMLRPVAPSR